MRPWLDAADGASLLSRSPSPSPLCCHRAVTAPAPAPQATRHPARGNSTGKKKSASAAASPEITQQWRGPRGPLACDQLCGETEARKGTEVNPSQQHRGLLTDPTGDGDAAPAGSHPAGCWQSCAVPCRGDVPAPRRDQSWHIPALPPRRLASGAIFGSSNLGLSAKPSHVSGWLVGASDPPPACPWGGPGWQRGPILTPGMGSRAGTRLRQGFPERTREGPRFGDAPDHLL